MSNSHGLAEQMSNAGPVHGLDPEHSFELAHRDGNLATVFVIMAPGVQIATIPPITKSPAP